MMYWYGGGMGAWGYALMTLGLILFWGALIAGGVALFRYAGRGEQQASGPAQPQPSSPERLLAERFARGEIDEEEYRRRLEALQTTGHAATPANGANGPPARTGAG